MYLVLFGDLRLLDAPCGPVAIWNMQSRVNGEQSTAVREFAYALKGSRSFYMHSAEGREKDRLCKGKGIRRWVVLWTWSNDLDWRGGLDWKMNDCREFVKSSHSEWVAAGSRHGPRVS